MPFNQPMRSATRECLSRRPRAQPSELPREARAIPRMAERERAKDLHAVQCGHALGIVRPLLRPFEIAANPRDYCEVNEHLR